uniref:Survival of motor neuron-related-splicing factor 30 n=1 Tax=Anopheles stephensi TaxID=30069 RepID=A0A182YC51_ANOST
MGLLEQLQEQGWYITQPGLDKLLEGEKNGTSTNVDVKQVVKLALNVDLREYGAGALSSLASRGAKSDSFDGPSVVQLVKLRNLGAPKVNEESKVAPRLLKLTVTDGQTQYVALEHEHIPSLSLNTPPGTKILLKNGPIRIMQGVMMLSDKNVQVLGGHVTALVEKWELSRTMAKYAKGGRLMFSTSGPPPWIPFGQKIQQPVANSDKDFKSLQPKEKEESTENTAFNALRNDAIAEATKLGTKKTFGGGAKQMVDANVQKIMDKGFTEDQATHALKLTRNNVHRALSNLQRIEDRKQAQAEGGGGKMDGGGKSGGKRGFGKRDDDAELLQSKPSGKVSLFDYFGDILADTEPSSGSGGAGGGKKTSKESTPVEGKEQSRARSDSSGRQTGSNRNHHQLSKNAPATTRSHGDSATGNYNTNGGSQMVNGSSSKSYNQQRFENNISSSFANRNTATSSSGRGGGDRGRGEAQQHQQGNHGQYANQSRDQQSGYKQSDYYGSSGNSRYRGANTSESHSTNTSNNPPSSGAGGARGGNSRGGGGDSKYNQQHQSSGYSHSSQQQQRTDGYNNNSSNSNATGGGKYNGKGQSNNNASGGGYGNSYGSESRNQQPSAQYGSGSHEGRTAGGKSGSGTQSGATPQQQQPQQSSYGGASKQSGYHNQHPGSGSSYNNGNAVNGNQQYNQQASGGGGSGGGGNHGNNYSGGGNNGPKNSTNKGGRYGGKDESHKYAGGNASLSTSTTTTTSSSQQSKKGSSKGHHGTQQQPPSHSNAAHSNHPPEQHSSSYSSSGGKQGAANANSKVNQATEQMGSMQISDSKPSGYNATNSNNNASHAPASSASSSSTANKPGSMKQTSANNHASSVVQQQQQQQHVPQVASPPGVASQPMAVPTGTAGPGGPSPGAPVTPSPGIGVGGGGGPPNVPKNFIQLPNGYNYNPYQIMGFQNKQTNEFALNVLKSQQQFDPMQQPPHLGTPGPVPPTVSPVGPNVMPMPGPNVTPTGVLAQAPPPATTVIAPAPQPGSVPGHGALGPAGMPMAPAPMAPTAATMPAVYPNWKIGDRCWAKYWEDGGFYTAEITDTSKNTFVVHFLEYGNYEEVLKKDCIPITQAPTPAAPAPMALGYNPAPSTPHLPPPHPAAAAAPVPFAPHPGAPHPHLPHQHHHVPHHAMAAAPGAYQAPMQDVTNQHTHYSPFKPGPMPPVPSPMPTPPGQGQLPPVMNQYQPAQHHLHQPQQQQQQQPPQQQHHLSQQQQQQQQQQQGGHMPPHHHQSQMQPHGGQQRPGGKFREQRPMYVPPAQRK